MLHGGQYVMTCGTTPMLLWFASSWGTHTLEVSFTCLLSDNNTSGGYIN